MPNFLSQLSCKILIFNKKLIDDEAGGFAVSWYQFLELFSNHSQFNHNHIFTIRYRNEVKVGMKILCDNSFYLITEIIINKNKKSLKLLTQKDI